MAEERKAAPQQSASQEASTAPAAKATAPAPVSVSAVTDAPTPVKRIRELRRVTNSNGRSTLEWQVRDLSPGEAVPASAESVSEDMQPHGWEPLPVL